MERKPLSKKEAKRQGRGQRVSSLTLGRVGSG
jgi:hypothetical protein